MKIGSYIINFCQLRVTPFYLPPFLEKGGCQTTVQLTDDNLNSKAFLHKRRNLLRCGTELAVPGVIARDVRDARG